MNDATPVTAVAKVDLSAYEMLEFATLTVQDASGQEDMLYEGKPVQIVLFSQGSKEGVRASHKAAQLSHLRQMGMVRGKIDKNIGEATDKEEVDRLVAMTKEIINFPVTPKELYSNTLLLYITKQAQRFIADDANFAKPSTPI